MSGRVASHTGISLEAISRLSGRYISWRATVELVSECPGHRASHDRRHTSLDYYVSVSNVDRREVAEPLSLPINPYVTTDKLSPKSL